MSTFILKLKLIGAIIMANLTQEELTKFTETLKSKGASQEVIDAVKGRVTELETKVQQLTEFSDNVSEAIRDATLDEAATVDAIVEAANANEAIPENDLTPAFPQ